MRSKRERERLCSTIKKSCDKKNSRSKQQKKHGNTNHTKAHNVSTVGENLWLYFLIVWVLSLPVKQKQTELVSSTDMTVQAVAQQTTTAAVHSAFWFLSIINIKKYPKISQSDMFTHLPHIPITAELLLTGRHWHNCSHINSISLEKPVHTQIHS